MIFATTQTLINRYRYASVLRRPYVTMIREPTPSLKGIQTIISAKSFSCVPVRLPGNGHLFCHKCQARQGSLTL
jgi:hypothetical protein